MYAHWGVPDTPEGRFEMIVLHLVLVLRRLSHEGEAGRALGQALTEAFVVDLDDTLREMTIGDLAVPRQVKRAVAALHDRYGTYGAALDNRKGENLLNSAIGARLANLRGAEGLDISPICAYVDEASRRLELRTRAQILSGDIVWPEVDAISNGQTAAG